MTTVKNLAMCLYLGVWIGDLVVPKNNHCSVDAGPLLLEPPRGAPPGRKHKGRPAGLLPTRTPTDLDRFYDVANVTGLTLLWFASMHTLLNVYLPWNSFVTKGDHSLIGGGLLEPNISVKSELQEPTLEKLRHELMNTALSNLCPPDSSRHFFRTPSSPTRATECPFDDGTLQEFDILAWIIWGRTESGGFVLETTKFRAPEPPLDLVITNPKVASELKVSGWKVWGCEIQPPSEETDPYFRCIPHMSTGGHVSHAMCVEPPVTSEPMPEWPSSGPSHSGTILVSVIALLVAMGAENHDPVYHWPMLEPADFLEVATIWTLAFAWIIFYTRVHIPLADSVGLQRGDESCAFNLNPSSHYGFVVDFAVGGRLRPRIKPVTHSRSPSEARKKRVTFADTGNMSQPETDKVVAAPGCTDHVIDLERMRTELVLDKLASSSRKIFDNQLQFWFIYCRVRNRWPVWRDNSPSLERENFVLDYVVQTGVIDRKAPATVKVRLASIRSHHLALGLPDPFFHMPRLSMALAGLSRRYGRRERRLPVTTQMLAWLKLRLEPHRYPDRAIIWAAIALGFFFLLRASEYLKPNHPSRSNKGLLGRHVLLCREGKPVSQSDFRLADEVKVEIQGSKTDIYNRGEHRNHFVSQVVSHGARLCVVEAIIILCSHFPDRFFGNARDDFLLRDIKGDLITREEIQALLQIAAEKVGAEPGDYGSHSLRFGGASALWAAFHDTGLVKRWGRWATDCFHTYLWEDRKGADGIAEAMAASDITPA